MGEPSWGGDGRWTPQNRMSRSNLPLSDSDRCRLLLTFRCRPVRERQGRIHRLDRQPTGLERLFCGASALSIFQVTPYSFGVFHRTSTYTRQGGAQQNTGDSPSTPYIRATDWTSNPSDSKGFSVEPQLRPYATPRLTASGAFCRKSAQIPASVAENRRGRGAR